MSKWLIMLSHLIGSNEVKQALSGKKNSF